MNTLGLKLVTTRTGQSEATKNLYKEINGLLPKEEQMTNTESKNVNDFIKFFNFQKRTGIKSSIIDFYEKVSEDYPVLPSSIYEMYEEVNNKETIENVFSENNFSIEKLLEILSFKRILKENYKSIEDKILLDKNYKLNILKELKSFLDEVDTLPQTSFFNKLKNRITYKFDELTVLEIAQKVEYRRYQEFYSIIYNLVANNTFDDELKNFGLEDVDYSYSTEKELLSFLMLQKPKNFISVIKQLESEDCSFANALTSFDIVFLQTMSLNTLNSQQVLFLIENISKSNQVDLINWFRENQKIPTIKEFIALHGIVSYTGLSKEKSKSKVKTYCKLNMTKEDDKLRTIKELNNANFFNLPLADRELLIKKITKPIYQMMNNNKHHIKSAETFLKYLVVEEFVEDLTLTENDILFVYESKVNKPVKNIEEVKLHVLQGETLQELQKNIKTSNDFMVKYIDNILNALGNGMINIINTYFKESKKEIITTNFVPIVKAFLMGEDSFNLMKFFEGDLSKEVQYEVSQVVEDIWKTNTSTQKGKFTAYETYSFENTMRLGELPVLTCMHWNKRQALANGAYNHCLLSNFDSNKKIIMVKRDDKVIARAILRLTKVSKTKEQTNDFTFVDVEKLERSNAHIKQDEKLVLFIERIYCCDSTNLSDVQNIMIELMTKKAEEMELSLYANFVTPKSMKTANQFMYISKSKNGYQYIDSLRGEQAPNAGGAYIEGHFAIY